MKYYYVALQTKTHALLLERRLKERKLICELVYMPRQIMWDLCNMGVKFPESELNKAMVVIKESHFPAFKVYMEVVNQYGSSYYEVKP